MANREFSGNHHSQQTSNIQIDRQYLLAVVKIMARLVFEVFYKESETFLKVPIQKAFSQSTP